jgi:hypothetical protein
MGVGFDKVVSDPGYFTNLQEVFSICYFEVVVDLYMNVYVETTGYRV